MAYVPLSLRNVCRFAACWFVLPFFFFPESPHFRRFALTPSACHSPRAFFYFPPLLSRVNRPLFSSFCCWRRLYATLSCTLVLFIPIFMFLLLCFVKCIAALVCRSADGVVRVPLSSCLPFSAFSSDAPAFFVVVLALSGPMFSLLSRVS